MLMDDWKTECVLMEKRRTPDGEGGFTTAWEEGAAFMAAIVLESSTEVKIAEAQGVTGVYTIYTEINAPLGYHDVVKRRSDGQVFRVTKLEDSTPKAATFQFSKVSAERWELTA